MRIFILLLLLVSVSCVHRQNPHAHEATPGKTPFLHQLTTAEKPWTHESFKNDPDAFQFAVLTDRTGGMRKGIFASAVTKVNSIQPEFVVSVGDYIQGYTSDPATLRGEWEEMDDLTSQFEMPFFFLPGNHDITNAKMQTLYEERFGSRYYAFVYKDVLFLCLDTQDHPVASHKNIIRDAGLLPEQVEWARNVLREHRGVRWTFVLMHQPLWLNVDPRGWDEVESALGNRDFTVFAGHLHRYKKSTRYGKNYFVLATTGGGSQLRGPEYGEFDHAVWVTMAEDGPRVANLLLDGIRSEDVYTHRTAEFHQALEIACTADPAQRLITGTLHVSNPFLHPLSVAATWTDVPGWQLRSTIDPKPIGPGKKKTYSLEARYEPETDMSRFPELSLECAAGSELNGVFPFNHALQRAFLAMSRPHLEIGRPADAPTIDGTLGESEWAGAATIPQLMNLESPSPAADEATAWCAYDDDAFYLAGRFVQDPAALRLNCSQPGHALWEDDSVELFFDTNRDGETYAQVILTANNIARRTNLGTIETATGRTGDSWTVEIRIPWDALSHTDVKAGDTLGFNLRRNRVAGGRIRVSEWTSTLAGTPHAPDLFGIIQLR